MDVTRGDRVDLTAVEANHVRMFDDGLEVDWCHADEEDWPCDTTRMAEALRIARDSLVAITGIPPTDDTANAALDRIDALVDFGGES